MNYNSLIKPKGIAIMKKTFGRFLPILIIISLILSTFSGAVCADSGDIIVLYTNDVHCATEDYSILAAYRAQLISEGHTVITVDAGDAIQGEMIGALTDGAAIVEIMNKVGYDAAAIGNHEFDYTVDTLLSLAESADFEYICANFMYIPTATDMFAPYVIKEVGDEKIAIVGISTPETYTSSTTDYFKDEYGNFIYSFLEDEFYETIQNAIDDAINDGATTVIAVGHLGISGSTEGWRSIDVIANTIGIDALIDAHSHETIVSDTYANAEGSDVILSSTGTKLAYFGEMRISQDGITTALINPDELDIDTMGDEAKAAYDRVQSVIDGYNEEFEYLYDEIGESEVLLTDKYEDGSRAIRLDETNLGNFVTDAYIAATGADIAFCNGGGIRTSVAAGKINRKMIMDVNPWNNETCILEITGQQLLDALEYGVHALPDELGSFPHVSGVTFEVHSYIDSPVVTDELGDFVSINDGMARRVANVKVKGVAVDPNQTYTLAGSQYMLMQSGYKMFADATVIADEGLPTDTEMLVEYFTETLGGRITEAQYGDPLGDGRITIISEAYIAGDVNGDGTVDAFDYLIVKSIYFESYNATDEEIVRADVYDDNIVDMFDYLNVKTIYFERN